MQQRRISRHLGGFRKTTARLVGLALIAGALVVTPQVAAQAAVTPVEMLSNSPCQDVVVVAARGSGENSPADRWLGGPVGAFLESYASQVTDRRVGFYPVIYPAQDVRTLMLLLKLDPTYFRGLDDGVNDAKQFLTTRYAMCPMEHYVLVGYSQGAMVIHRILSRLGEYKFPSNRIDGAALIADGDRQVLHSEQTRGSATPLARGITWRLPAIQLLTKVTAIPSRLPSTGDFAIAAKTYSICDFGDIVCDTSIAFTSPVSLLAGVAIHKKTYTTYKTVGTVAGEIAAVTNAVAKTVPMTVPTVSLPAAQVGVAYRAEVSAKGGPEGKPYTFTLNPKAQPLPPGISLIRVSDDAAAFVGVPTAAGLWPIRVKATDVHGQIVNRDLRLLVTTVPTPSVSVGEGSARPGDWTARYLPALGVPVNKVHPWGPGCIQEFKGGALGDAALMQLNCTESVIPVTGAHWRRMVSLGSPVLGYPYNSSYRYGASWTQDFKGGSWGLTRVMVPDVDNTHAYVVRSGVRDRYLADGGAGKWGVPLADEVASLGGLRSTQRFTGGVLTWQKYGVGQGAASPSGWTAAYDAGLGVPASAVHTWGPGCIQDFRGGTLGDAALMQRNCTGPVMPVTGAHWRRVAAIGSPTIGYPTNWSHRYGKSWTQDFEGGTWGWNLLMVPDVDNTHAYVVRSGMRDRYISDGGADGKWGSPTSDEYLVPIGARQNFTGGVMTWRAFSDTLSEGQTLATNGKLVSSDERFTLIVQGDGNLVLYGPSGPEWATGTGGASSRLVMQGDSNVVLYDGNGGARWATGGMTFRGAHLVLQSDGNLVVYDRAGVAIWSRFAGRINTDPTGPVAVRSTLTGRYWTAELDYTGDWRGAVRAERTAVGGWERFQLVGDCRSASGCAIKNLQSGKYLTAELNFTGTADRMVRASATNAGLWERFQLVGDCGSVGGCGVRSVANGRYLSADYGIADSSNPQFSLVRAKAAAISGWESFRIYQW